MPEIRTIFEQSKNLLNEDGKQSGFMGSTGTFVASEIYNLSDYIEVEEGETYSMGSRSLSKGCRFLAAFDSLKQIISSASSDSEIGVYTVPSGVVYIRLTWLKVMGDCQLEKGGSRTSYAPYGCIRAYGGDFFARNVRSRFTDINWLTYGDSLTAQAMWQHAASSLLSCQKLIYGVGGSTITGADGSTTAICQTTRINALSASAKIVTVMGGTNDWAQDVPIGAINDSDPATTFYGGLNRLFLNLCTKYPSTPITICTPPYGEFIAFAVRGWANGFTNNAGFTLKDYCEAIRLCAKKWSVPVIDFDAECGINSINRTTYMQNDGNYIHLNEAGANRVGSVVAGRIIQVLSYGISY